MSDLWRLFLLKFYWRNSEGSRLGMPFLIGNSSLHPVQISLPALISLFSSDSIAKLNFALHKGHRIISINDFFTFRPQ